MQKIKISLILKEEYMLRLFEDRNARKIFGPERDEIKLINRKTVNQTFAYSAESHQFKSYINLSCLKLKYIKQ